MRKSRILVTTSWRLRIDNALLKMLKNSCRFKLFDEVAIYLSSDEFGGEIYPEKLDSLMKIYPEIKIHWVKENLKSFKKLLAFKDFPNSILVIHDDDFILGYEDYRRILRLIESNNKLMYAGWILYAKPSKDLKYLYKYLPRSSADYYTTSDGIYCDSSIYSDINIDPYIGLKTKCNDDDYYMSIINAANNIKSKKIDLNYHKLRFKEDMHNSAYTKLGLLKYFRSEYPEKFEILYNNLANAVKGKIFLHKHVII